MSLDEGDLLIEEHGAARHDRVALSVLAALETVLPTGPDRPGVRLAENASLTELLAAERPFGHIVAERIGPAWRPVRAVLFDKTPRANWALSWHQDRTIAVRDRHEVAGYGPWSVKTGIVHVEPPFAIIAAMVTLRIHLDDVPHDNAPLLIAPGSHRLGRVAESEITDVASRCGTAVCTAMRGDVWAYATPIIHASSPSSGYAHRRVLQVDYSATALPSPLAWLGIG